MRNGKELGCIICKKGKEKKNLIPCVVTIGKMKEKEIISMKIKIKIKNRNGKKKKFF
jgi:hypothetical protein